MNTRSTSIEAFNAIRDGGLLSKMRWETYAALYRIRPATAGEISEELTRGGTPAGGGRAGPGNVSARLVELQELGVVQEVGQRTCRVTGRDVILWTTTDQLPSGKIERNGPVRPKPEIFKAALVELRDLVRFAQARGFQMGPNLVAVGVWMVQKFEQPDAE